MDAIKAMEKLLELAKKNKKVRKVLNEIVWDDLPQTKSYFFRPFLPELDRSVLQNGKIGLGEKKED